MSIKLSDLLVFAAGAAIGSVVTWKVTKDKYEQMMQEAVDSVKEAYAHKAFEEYTVRECVEAGIEVELDEQEEVESHALEEMRTAYNNIAREAGYTTKEVEDVTKPYVISPEEFDELDGYNSESLNYYADGVLTDQYDNVIDDPEDIIGDIDPDEHFGEFEEDSVHVRNDVTKCDYEILRDTRCYHQSFPNDEE